MNINNIFKLIFVYMITYSLAKLMPDISRNKNFTGEWHNGDTKEIVAVKVLKDTATPETEQDFMREVDIMSTFSHTNILSLKGMVLRDATNNPWMVFEYMPHGDLAEVLRANSPQFRLSKAGMQPLTKVS